MDLVFFMYCMEHVVRISRVIALERGNMLLIGIGGSGRKSAARLAASILEQKIFTIEVSCSVRPLPDFKQLNHLDHAGYQNVSNHRVPRRLETIVQASWRGKQANHVPIR